MVVKELRNLNNFSSMAAIAAGLNSAPVTRLKRTKEMLGQKTLASKADLDSTLDSTRNFSNYKDMLKTINPPCVPFFGMFSVSLTISLESDGPKGFGCLLSLSSRMAIRITFRYRPVPQTACLPPHPTPRSLPVPSRIVNRSSTSSNVRSPLRSSGTSSSINFNLTILQGVSLYPTLLCAVLMRRTSGGTTCMRSVFSLSRGRRKRTECRSSCDD